MVILRCYLFVTGGRNGVEWVASLLWNQWPEWSRMGGRNAVEYAAIPFVLCEKLVTDNKQGYIDSPFAIQDSRFLNKGNS